LFAGNPPALDGDRQGGQLKPDASQARHACGAAVLREAARHADFVPKIIEAAALHLIEQSLVVLRELILERLSSIIAAEDPLRFICARRHSLHRQNRCGR
jgi:hypothetical protein